MLARFVDIPDKIRLIYTKPSSSASEKDNPFLEVLASYIDALNVLEGKMVVLARASQTKK